MAGFSLGQIVDSQSLRQKVSGKDKVGNTAMTVHRGAEDQMTEM
jgi:hypothetical protein